MDGSISLIQERLKEESSKCSFPYEKSSIHERYKDTSVLVYKENRSFFKGSFLSFGSRRTSLVSSYGNTPTFMRRSFSSSGTLEFAVEQFSSHRRPGNRLLPSITEKKTAPLDVTEPPKESVTDDDSASDEYNSTNRSPTKSSRVMSNDFRRNLANSKNFHHYDVIANKNRNSNSKLDSGQCGLPSTPNSSLDASCAIKSTSLDRFNNQLDNVALNSEKNMKERQNDVLVNDPLVHTNSEKSSVFPAIAQNSWKSRNTQVSNNDFEHYRGNILPSECTTVRGKPTIPSPESLKSPYSQKQCNVLKPQRHTNETKRQEIDLPSLTSSNKGPGEITCDKSSTLLTTYVAESNHASIDYAGGASSDLRINSKSRNNVKLIEKTVGENLLTTEGIVKSIPHVAASTGGTLDDQFIYSNSSRLCSVM